MNRATIWVALALGAALAPTGAGCGRSDDLGPPQIAYGHAECELCRMIISEEPFAAAAVVVAPEGVRKVAFDDIGCLLRFLRDEPPATRVIAYVHDYESGRWIDAGAAAFVRSDDLTTPMASHLAACESPRAAEELLRRYRGAQARLDQLLASDAPGGTGDALSPERSSP